MEKKEVKRKYLFSDAKLVLIGITKLSSEFNDLIITKELKVGARDIQQEDRVEAGNAIYTTLVSYTKTGQDIWVSKDLAKYNDYEIYNTESGEDPDEPQDPV